jgi:hypothetical protein
MLRNQHAVIGVHIDCCLTGNIFSDSFLNKLSIKFFYLSSLHNKTIACGVFTLQNLLIMRNTNHVLLSSFFLIISFSLFAQKEDRPSYRNYFDRGAKAVGIQIGVAGGYPINSVTILDISNDSKDYGLLALPSYGWFVERNFLVGASAIIGFSNYSSFNDSYDYSTSPPSVTRYQYKGRSIDLGLAPFLRYYVPLGKRNVVSLFGQGSLPVFYSKSRNETTPNQINNWYSNQQGIKVIASLGLGVSVNGRLGSLEINGNNTGLYIGVQKYLTIKKK